MAEVGKGLAGWGRGEGGGLASPADAKSFLVSSHVRRKKGWKELVKAKKKSSHSKQTDIGRGVSAALQQPAASYWLPWTPGDCGRGFSSVLFLFVCFLLFAPQKKLLPRLD